ncbi:phenylalanine--tRNA ligase subunit beta [Candidatus Nomurabacteria bacterium]|nr:phenylalanine--tRNA ligase subunit beta [Candidatus Nomurabacteria bacterium]
MKISYNWLKWYIPEAPPANKLADIFNYHICEVESVQHRVLDKDKDWIFDLKVLPNRAHDLLSHQGVARELASLLDIKYVDPTPKYKIPASAKAAPFAEVATKAKSAGKPELKIDVQTPLCRRYMGRIIRGIKIGPSPEWMVKHLESIGQRSINNIVDAANIVMFDCGQPTHAFDLDKMNSKIIVREAENDEDITTLDNQGIKLKSSNMVIVDSKNILAIAGIKGGKIAEVDNNTKNIILEVANFDPVSVRKTAQAFNLFTDARKRFENDLSPELAPYAMRELSALIFEMCPDAIFEDVVDVYPHTNDIGVGVYPEKQKEKKLSFSAERISKILGLKVSVKEIENILQRYNFRYKENKGKFEVVVPPMRLDLAIEEDMAEEIGRILGYDKVKPQIPHMSDMWEPQVNEIYAKISWVRNKLLADGYSEVMTYTFREKGEIEVQNSASDKKFLRTNLTDGLKESVKLNHANAPLLGIDEIKVFEIGTVFKKDKEQINICFSDKKNITEVSLNDFCKDMLSSDSPLEEYPLGGGGKFIHPVASATPQEGNRFKMWSLFPFIARDIAVFVPEKIKSLEIEKIIKKNMGNMVIRGPELFDEFKKGNQISYAFRLVFQSYDRTLTDAEVNEIMDKITDKIKKNKGWQVR